MAKRTPLQRAIKLAGGSYALADRLGISRQAVERWPKAPAGRAYAIEQITGGKVTCHELRPDIFPAPKDRAS